MDDTLKEIIERNLELFEPVIKWEDHLAIPTEGDKQNVKALLEVLYNDDEGESLLDQYPDVRKFVTE